MMKHIFLYFVLICSINLQDLRSQDTIVSEQLILLLEDGKYIAIDSTSTIKEGYTGVSVDYNIDGSIYQFYVYSNGILKKTIKYLDDNSSKEVLYDSLGLESGPYIEYDKLGRVKVQGQYFDGLKTGIWRFYDQGNLQEMGEYLNDEKNGVWLIYNSLNEIISRSIYQNGEKLR